MPDEVKSNCSICGDNAVIKLTINHEYVDKLKLPPETKEIFKEIPFCEKCAISIFETKIL